MHLFKRAKPRPSAPKPRSSAAALANQGLCLRVKVCGGRPHPAPGRKAGLSGAGGAGLPEESGGAKGEGRRKRSRRSKR